MNVASNSFRLKLFGHMAIIQFGDPKAVLLQLSTDKTHDKEFKNDQDSIPTDVILRRHVMAGQLALQCLKSTAARKALLPMTKKMTNLILSKDDTIDVFIRTCLVQCIIQMSFESFSSSNDIDIDLSMRNLIENNVVDSLVYVLSDAVAKLTDIHTPTHTVSQPAPVHLLVDSVCLAFGTIITTFRYLCSVETKNAFFHLLERQKIIRLILKWTLLKHGPSEVSPIASIQRTGLSLLKFLCEVVLVPTNSRLLQPWFETIKQENIVPTLISLCSTNKRFARDELSLVTTGIIESILETVMRLERLRASNSMEPIQAILKLLVQDICKFMEQWYLSQSIGFSDCSLYQTIAIFSCSLILENDKGSKSSSKNQMGQKVQHKLKHARRGATIQPKTSFLPSWYIVTLTWTMAHTNKQISKVAMTAFRGMFSHHGSLTFSHAEVISLLENGYMYILITLREIFRTKKSMQKIILPLQTAISIMISTGEYLILNGLVTGEKSKGIIIEQLFLMHSESCREIKEVPICKMRDCMCYLLPQVTVPWINLEEIFTVVKKIMRIYYLVSKVNVKKKLRYTMLDERSLDILSKMNKLKGLQIEVFCKDKVAPAVLQCPPIDKVISNAPILALQIARGLRVDSFNHRAIVAQIHTSSYDATEDFFCHLEFGTDYTNSCKVSTNMHHCLEVVKIAYNFGSQSIVDSYLKSCISMVDTRSLHLVLETAMVTNQENSVLQCILFTTQNLQRFKKCLARFVSGQRVFFKCVRRLVSLNRQKDDEVPRFK